MKDKRSILLVEDEILIAMEKQQELEKYGYTVRYVNTGEKAVTIVNENIEIDLILMDIDLGKGIDGTEAAALILDDHDIPIVFLSSHTEPEIVKKTEKITSYGYIEKQSSITVLDASIKMAFKLFEAKVNEKAKEEALRQYAHIVSNSSDMLALLDTQFRYLAANQAYVEAFKLTSEQLIGKTAAEIFGVEFFNTTIKSNAIRCLGGEEVNYQDWFDLPGYEWQYMNITYYPYYSKDNKIIGFVVNGRNITERKQAEEEILALSKFPSENPNPVLRISKDGSILFANQSSVSLIETWEEKQCIPDDWRQVIENVLAKGISQEIEVESNEKILSLFFTPIVEANYVNVYGRDITKRKQAVDELLQNQYYLTKSQEMGKIGTWELDLQNNILNWTDENYKIFGRPLGTEMNYELFLNCVHPDDRDLVDENWKAALNNRPYDIDHRIIVNDKIKWVREKAEIKFDKKDNPITAIGFTQDITEFKLVKDELIKSEILLKSSIESTSDIIILSIDKEYRHLYFNQNHIDVMMASYNTVVEIGMNVLDCITNEIDKKNSKINFDRALAGESHSIIQEYGNVHRLYFEIRYNPIFDEDGKIIGATSFAFNISEKKQLEDEIKRQLFEKEITLKETHHRIKNNFATVISLLSLQSNSTNNPVVQAALRDSIGRVGSIKVLYEKLLLTEDYRTTSVKDYLDNLIDDIKDLFPENIELVLKIDIDDFQLNSKQLIPIGIIVNEILTNIMKYAFIDRSSGVIEINLKEHKGNVILSIQDNGNGLPEGFDISKSEGFGLILVKILTEQLEGSYTFSDKQGGTESILKFPIGCFNLKLLVP